MGSKWEEDTARGLGESNEGRLRGRLYGAIEIVIDGGLDDRGS